ncbi:M48 family metallopeptidase [Pseudodesulfovibrio piezophilus]|uniref:YgjP-like metallopeptidase domain-containing protein n=1 Tax=Pseudodesulfovibrio piezophilus (strain DSM 21447 / JCM 15486 / C1TLV30) TaxID=1322246 RepID=M1WML2_PSEP2|nr:YgjP-like metallopeptidase domain-containing protein [Pseudodesulfovibrio piezophilus]CCH49770.1 conserved protein of unknown function [Pseudodesulfovibrio piezophilus C1TLV30]
MTEYCGIPLRLKKNSRAKRVLIKLVPGKGLEVVIPKRFDPSLVPGILDEKKRWIERTKATMEARGTDLSGRVPELPSQVDFQASQRSYEIGYVDRPGRLSIVENGSRLMVSGPGNDPQALLEALRLLTANKAREFILPRLDAMSRRLGLPYEALRVRRQKTRWGSCSARGTISVNAKLLFLPLELLDHLLLHELCHTVHLNHSKKYWSLVAHYAPEYLQLEDELKNGGIHVPNWFA